MFRARANCPRLWLLRGGMAARVTRIQVKAGTARYPVLVGDGAHAELPNVLARLRPSSIVLLYDRNVAPHVELLDGLLPRHVPALALPVPPGEKSKSLAVYESVARRCLRGKPEPDRSSVVLALGGGVVGDLAGFFAATWMRGVRIVHLPTTLLAMIDSAIGGKTALNLGGVKNQLGVFHQPSAVVCDIAMLNTLPAREYVSALAEAVKAGMTLEQRLLAFLERKAGALLRRSPAPLLELITACVRAKAKVVQRDERDAGQRMVLNYGHTIGHAVEAVARGELLHGECVAIGLAAEARIAVRAGLLDAKVELRQRALLHALGLPLAIPAGMKDAALLDAMSSDKKRAGRLLRFALPTGVGQWAAWDCPDAPRALAWARSER